MANRINVLSFRTINRISNVAATNDINTGAKEQHIVLEILDEYCSNSTLHGISYMGAKDKSLVEKIWWLIMFVLSLTACALLISKTWTKWKENPVIISFENEQIPIWQIPFPAVTVCPFNKIVNRKYNYTEKYSNRNNLSDEDYKIFLDLSLVCNLADVFNNTMNFTDESAIDAIRNMSTMKTDDIVQETVWQNLRINEYYFTKHLTEEGICFSFNSLNQNDMFTDQISKNTIYIDHNFTNEGWNIEDGYLPELKLSTYPRRTAIDGRISGLTILIYYMSYDLDYTCGSPTSGFKVTLHNPAETPKVAEQYFLIPQRSKASIIVRPEVTRTDQNVRSLPPHTRKCYFSNEKSLRFFKVYTENNCRVECDANITQHYCGCVPFHMPRDDDTRICGYGKIDCLREVKNALLDFQVLEKLTTEQYGKNKEKIEKSRDILINCDCMPSCSSLHYTAETSLTKYDMNATHLATGHYDNLPTELFKMFTNGTVITSQVDIFFKESQFLALQRSELYGQTDFLSNCGGLLGLFMGFSVLSILEIFYFLTIRLWFKYKIRNKT